MDLKKVKSKNPGWNFTKKISKKASKSVLDSATQSNLDIDTYHNKYVAQVKKKKVTTDSVDQPKLDDKEWSMLIKTSTEPGLTDFTEDPKTGFYDAEGNEVASQG